MRTYKYIILTVLVCFHISCTKELPFPEVDDTPLMVVNSLFSPEEGIIIHVSESCHINKPDCKLQSIANAEVKLLNADGTVLSVLDHTESGIYTSREVTIDHGKKYQLEVNDMTSNLASISTNSHVPMPVNAKLLSIEETSIEGRNVWGFNIEIDDDPNVENYYVIEGSFDYPNGSHEDYESEINGYIEPHARHFSSDPNAENNKISQGLDFEILALRGVYLSDKNFNGQKYVIQVGINDDDSYMHSEIIGNIVVKSVSKEMFDYHLSLEEVRILAFNPFSEPVQLYSNIKDGIGIFAGFTKTALSEELPESEFWFDEIVIENNGCTAPCTVKFKAIGGDKLNYFWNFGDGNTSKEKVIEHRYEEVGEYNGVFEATSNNSGHYSDFSIEIN